MQIIVRDNNVDQALRALKKKLQREGVYREMKLRRHYEKPSEKRAREKAAAVRRARKLERKRAERDGALTLLTCLRLIAQQFQSDDWFDVTDEMLSIGRPVDDVLWLPFRVIQADTPTEQALILPVPVRDDWALGMDAP